MKTLPPLFLTLGLLSLGACGSESAPDIHSSDMESAMTKAKAATKADALYGMLNLQLQKGMEDQANDGNRESDRA